ncbi:MAG: hypothetical protein K2F94_03725 [Muribaculaceae bacterium]|nr:hypothetical protein [Muribaculaceae bacterium]
MKISVSYSELSEILLQRYGQTVRFSFLEERAIEAVVKKRALIVTLPIPVRLYVKSVRKSGVMVNYRILAGVDKVVGLALNYLIDKYPDIKPGITVENDSIDISLSKIKPANVFVKNFELRDIRFNETGIDIEICVK